jgi:hypothetical protein
MNSETNEIYEKIIEELITIRSLLERMVRGDLKQELETVATTDERQKIWSLLDGVSSTAEIATKVGISQRAVQLFMKDLIELDLITIEKRGYPKRRFNYIPSRWRVEVSSDV